MSGGRPRWQNNPADLETQEQDVNGGYFKPLSFGAVWYAGWLTDAQSETASLFLKSKQQTLLLHWTIRPAHKNTGIPRNMKLCFPKGCVRVFT